MLLADERVVIRQVHFERGNSQTLARQMGALENIEKSILLDRAGAGEMRGGDAGEDDQANRKPA